MARQNFAHRSGVKFHVCRQHGVWFDDEETLEDLVEWVKSGGLAAARVEQQAEESHYERIKARLARAAGWLIRERWLDAFLVFRGSDRLYDMILGPFSLDRMVNAVERVRERLLRATAALERAGVPYAVVGGNAVAAWVARVDESAVRNTQDVDILVRRVEFEAVKKALSEAGFHYRRAAGIEMFLESPSGKARHAVHVIFAGEKERPEETVPNPDVADSEQAGPYRVLNLRALVQIKLTAFRDKDRTHLRDLLEVGLIDQSWTQFYPLELASRLQQLIDTPGR